MSTSEGKSEKNKGGRPTKYRKEYNEQVEKLCKLGADDSELADFFNVSESTINNWKISEPVFLESIKKGKQIADMNVADSLYNRALGYKHKEDKIFNNNGKALIVETEKHYAPDPTAAIFWLKNRRPKEWRDKQGIEHSGTVGVDDLSKLTTEELVLRAKATNLINQNKKDE